MEKEELTQLFNFFREIDKEKFIGRQTYLTDGVRKENDAEHAWHMAIMTVLLAGTITLPAPPLCSNPSLFGKTARRLTVPVERSITPLIDSICPRSE